MQDDCDSVFLHEAGFPDANVIDFQSSFTLLLGIELVGWNGG